MNWIFFIPEDGILHCHCHENLKSYKQIHDLVKTKSQNFCSKGRQIFVVIGTHWGVDKIGL
jgi:hypothetical protein